MNLASHSACYYCCGGSLLHLQYNGPQNPVLIIKAPILLNRLGLWRLQAQGLAEPLQTLKALSEPDSLLQQKGTISSSVLIQEYP